MVFNYSNSKVVQWWNVSLPGSFDLRGKIQWAACNVLIQTFRHVIRRRTNSSHQANDDCWYSLNYDNKTIFCLIYTEGVYTHQIHQEQCVFTRERVSIIEVEFFYEPRYFWKELNLCMIKAFHCRATSSVWHYDFFKHWKKKNGKAQNWFILMANNTTSLFKQV